ncbi:MAG: hypothetical protein KKA88_00095 [Gammaproteobacteria bacterium]|nr:hypothetical protein [Gammaproteobacteria bacterium]
MHMQFDRRKLLVTLLALPAGCAIQPLRDLKIEAIAPPPGVPSIRQPALGQSWTYQKFNIYNGERLAVEREEVIALSPRIVIRRQTETGQVLPEEQQAKWGHVLREPVWDYVLNLEQPLAHWPETLALGATAMLNTHYLMDGGSYRYWINVHARVMAWERIQVPAGSFNTLRIEKFIRLQHQDFGRVETIRREVLWLAPEVGRWVARETRGDFKTTGLQGDSYGREDYLRWELSAWQ